jgi:hypothetical protein
MGLLVHSVVFILVVWAMMNVKKDMPKLPQIKDKVKKEEKKVVPPTKQADVVMKPGMMEEPFIDTGLQLGSMDLGQPVSM